MDQRLTAAAFFTIALSLACGDDGGPKGQTTVSQAEADFLGQIAAFDVVDRLASLHRFFTPTSTLVPRPGCDPDKSDPADTDTDGDGVPDDQTLTYTAANCSIDVVPPNGLASTLVSTGTIRTRDTSTGSTIYGFVVSYGNMRIVQTLTDGTSSEWVRDGFFAVGVRADGAASQEDMTSQFRSDIANLEYDYSYRLAWSSSFVPDAPIDPSSGNFPSGTGAIQGTFDFDGQVEGISGPFDFDVSTDLDLPYDPVCGAPFTSGRLRYALSSTGGKTGFTIEPTSSCSLFATATPFDER